MSGSGNENLLRIFLSAAILCVIIDEAVNSPSLQLIGGFALLLLGVSFLTVIAIALGSTFLRPRPDSMTVETIELIRIDEDGRVRVRLRAPQERMSYEYIYRAAAWVRWDNSLKEFFVVAEKREPEIQQFDRISDVVLNELGVQLQVASSTQLYDVSPELADHLRESMEP